MITPYHAKYYAYELTKRCASDSAEKLAGALVDARVDLNPHQVEAALFAFRSPFSKGALLADEVGLGKTIEAGLVLSQKWAERKRRILIITPSNLRKQWHQELQEKFFLPCKILESKSYNQDIKQGKFKPFEMNEIVLCSYQFARNKAADVNAIPWDLVVIDEAHRLRNVYKPSNVIANTLKLALQHAPKLLLTATPLQNSLLELFGLVSFIDDQAFGDLKSFRDQFLNLEQQEVFQKLKNRLKPICQRTLRQQVLQYIRYTKRLPIVQPFTPNESEDLLYNSVSDYLRRDNLQALPNSQRTLITLVLRKLLASSSFAIAGALETMIERLKKRIRKVEPEVTLEENLVEDYEGLEEVADEWEDEEAPAPVTKEESSAIEREIADLEGFRNLALSITHNSKGKALLIALDHAFAAADRLGASRKAIIFTESRKTQDYLLRVLADSPHKDGVVLFNGTNKDEKSRQIYAEWFARHDGTDKVTGSRTADMRSALVDYFKDQGQIMIATEAGAEGINLQFCSLVVNYDLPWNPQRVEQRIGRCHRYGQKHDVVVVNFLNQKNEADQRVFKLLSEKFQLFEGVFGASDEVLGAIESGVDFEKRISEIYQKCRTPEEINASFDQLQQELSEQISEGLTKTRKQLLENFDEEVHEKLKVNLRNSREYLNRYERLLIELTRHELDGHTDFVDDSAFNLKTHPFATMVKEIPLGLYELPRRSGDAHFYRLGHPLAKAVIAQAKDRALPCSEIVFDLTNHPTRVSALDAVKGQTGVLQACHLGVEALDQAEDHLIVSAIQDDGSVLDEDVAQKLLSLSARSTQKIEKIPDHPKLSSTGAARQKTIQEKINHRNAAFFEAEAAKLDDWTEDLKLGLEREMKELDRQIKEARRSMREAVALEDKVAFQKQMKQLEVQRNLKRKNLYEAQDKLEQQRDALITSIEGKLTQKVSLETLFTVRWSVV